MAMLRRKANDPQDARTLLAALSDCHKISRLAVGASPSNEIVSPPPTPGDDAEMVAALEKKAKCLTCRNCWQR